MNFFGDRAGAASWKRTRANYLRAVRESRGMDGGVPHCPPRQDPASGTPELGRDPPGWWGGSFGNPAFCPAVRESCVVEEEEESR